MNALKHLNEIFALIEKHNLNAAEQLVMLHLYNAFNRERWSAQVRLSDAALAEKCNLSRSQVYRAKKHLRELSLISYSGSENRRAATEYLLIDLCAKNRAENRANLCADENGVTAGEIATSAEDVRAENRAEVRDTEKNSYIRVRDENSKTEKPLRGEDAPEKFFDALAENVADAVETVKQIRVHVTRADINEVIKLNEAHGVTAVKAAISTVNKIRACVTLSDVAKMLELNERYGTERVAEAIDEVTMRRVHVTFQDIQSTIEAVRSPPLKIIKPKKSKGVVTHECSYSPAVNKPVFTDTGNEPWANIDARTAFADDDPADFGFDIDLRDTDRY